MKHIKIFEDITPSKFFKMIPIKKDEKTYFRKQIVGSIKRFTPQQFLYLEYAFASKLDTYKNWLLSVYPLNYYTDKSIYVDKDLNTFRLFPIDIEYRKNLIRTTHSTKEMSINQKLYRTKYIDIHWAKGADPEVYSISHVKGSKGGSPSNVKPHPFLEEITKASNPPEDIKTAHKIANTPVGKEIVAKEEKLKKASTYFQKVQFNQIKNDFSTLLDSINYLTITPSDLLSRLNTFKLNSKVTADGCNVYVITDDTPLIIYTKNKEHTRTFKELTDYLRKNLSAKLPFTKIEANIINPL